MATGFTASRSPARPYSSPGQLGGATPRSQQFNIGANQAGDVATAAGQDPGLNLSSQQFQAQIPGHVVQMSVLQPANPVSANGMAAADFERVLPGLSKPLPSPNGSSQASWDQGIYMRLAGRDEG
jgi:hypothetical protein